MTTPLLSTYSTGENRVTASTLAVFERIGLTLVQDLLEAATGSGDELTTVTFTNQVVGMRSTPDAVISAGFVWHFETKTKRGCYENDGHDRTQLLNHLSSLGTDRGSYLFVLTPDSKQPGWFDTLDSVSRNRLLWLSFRGLEVAINQVVDDRRRLVPEQTRFLLSELTAFYEAEGLLTVDDTVVVAARQAWDEYLEFGAYVCQANRSFRKDLKYFGFYRGGAIETTVASIRGDYFPEVAIDAETAARYRDDAPGLAELIDALLAAGVRPVGMPHGIFLLSKKDDDETVHLPGRILNDTRTAGGKNWAWTLSQRYTKLELLQSAKFTSDLAKGLQG